MRSSTKTLHFPLAGLDRSRSYGVATEPSENRVYATPLAVNVRGTDVFGGRYRGGSRPGLTEIATPDKPFDVFDKPTTFYRGRKIYADGKLWYASRSGDITDFNVSGDGDDPSRPVIGKVGFASLNDTEPITAVFCVATSALFVATRRSVWMCEGDVTTGSFVRISSYAGVVSKDAWAYDGTVFYFVSTNGIYAFAPGQGVVRVSDNVPEEISGMTNALVAYDAEPHALHIFTDKGDWFYDIAAKAWWPQEFHADHRPMAHGVVFDKVMFLGKDGRYRYFDKQSTSDGEYSIDTVVAIGPIRAGMSEDVDGMISKLSATLAVPSGQVVCDIYVGKSAEESVAATLSKRPVASVELIGGSNRNFRPRVRGAWVTLVLSSSAPWAFESMMAEFKSLGGVR